MGQEFIIKSQDLEDKVNQLLPSQGGFQAGVDLSASTTIIPIVDLTETAEGSNVRADLQTALSHNSITTFEVSNTSSTIVNTTGYYRVFGMYRGFGANNTFIAINDGATQKQVVQFISSTSGNNINIPFDFVIFLTAGDSIVVDSNTASGILAGCTRQIADIAGNLVNP